MIFSAAGAQFCSRQRGFVGIAPSCVIATSASYPRDGPTPSGDSSVFGGNNFPLGFIDGIFAMSCEQSRFHCERTVDDRCNPKAPFEISMPPADRFLHLTTLALAVSAVLLAGSSRLLADCPADLTSDGTVNAADLSGVLSGWGTTSGDITGDGLTDATDLAALLGAWGACPVEPVIDWILLTATNGTSTIAIDEAGVTQKSWTGATGGTSAGYLRADGSLVRPSHHAGGAYVGAASGGRIQIFNAAGTLTNDLIVSTAAFQQHHDIRPMPNGNILCICWEGHTQVAAMAAGRTTLTTAFWPDSVLEIRPTGTTTFEIVWKWTLWDHLIQDVNPALANYGVVSAHPELIDINLGTITAGDWTHMNAIDYDPVRDEIVLSSRSLNEVYVIDHSTTTAQAASHSGGARGKGGDILYRWGNPQNYDRGTAANKVFFTVHSATWIDSGLPGAGNILALNNGDRAGGLNDYSTVLEIVPPRDASGNYTIGKTAAYAPTSALWSYGAPGQIYGGATQCGAFRTLDNTTLITLTNSGRTFEINQAGTVVWDRLNPGITVPRAAPYRRINGLWIGP